MILKSHTSWGAHRDNSIFGYEVSIALTARSAGWSSTAVTEWVTSRINGDKT